MKPETQQRLLQALEQMKTDLSLWVKSQGLSEADVLAKFDAALLEENGLLASLLLGRANDVLGIEAHAPIQAEAVRKELAKFRAGDYPNYLLTLPEPAPEQLELLLHAMKSALPTLRHQLIDDAKGGPRFRKGGRPVEIPSPERRQRIREEIKQLRHAGSNLSDIFLRFAQREGVSASTIKRIWTEEDGDETTQESRDGLITKE